MLISEKQKLRKSKQTNTNNNDNKTSPEWSFMKCDPKWLLLPLSSRPFTIPEPTVPAPPRTNTTLSELNILAAASHNRQWKMENITQSAAGKAADEQCTASVPIQDALNGRPGAKVPPFSLEATPANGQNPHPQLSSRTLCVVHSVLIWCVATDCLRVRSHLKEVQTALEKFRSSVLLPPSGGEDGEVAMVSLIYLFLDPIGKSHFLTILIVLWVTHFYNCNHAPTPQKTNKQNKTKIHRVSSPILPARPDEKNKRNRRCWENPTHVTMFTLPHTTK